MVQNYNSLYSFKNQSSIPMGNYAVAPKDRMMPGSLYNKGIKSNHNKSGHLTFKEGYCIQRFGGVGDTMYRRTTIRTGKRAITVPDPVSMTKYLFDNYRLPMYSFLNRMRKTGKLSNIVGAKIFTKRLTREEVKFTDVHYWRDSRESFLADIQVELMLDTELGELIWMGTLVVFCSFTDKFNLTFDELTVKVDRRDYDPLDRFLVPVITNKRIDEYTEFIRGYLFPAEHDMPQKVSAEALAERLGLKVVYYDICDSRSIKGILYFSDGDLMIRPEIHEYDENGACYVVGKSEPTNVRISAGTIVINTSIINKEYSGFYIFHECIHNEFHYLFFRLQQMGSNDPRAMKTKVVEIEDDEDEKDVMFFIENQANRGAYGLTMPIGHTKKMINIEIGNVSGYRHDGEKYDKVIQALSLKLHQPQFLVRIRLIQLGYIKAKGSSQTVNGEVVPPFDFDIDSWRDSRHTYVIDEETVAALCNVSDGLNELIGSGAYVCAEGHVVKNDSRFVEEKQNKLVLTDFANAHVDDCCLRFFKLYRRESIGKNAFTHMYYDEDYLKQTAFYLSDVKNKAQLNGKALDDYDAKRLFLKEFPTNFKDAVEKLRVMNDMSLENMCEMLSMDRRTLNRWLEESRRYRNEDFLAILCLIFKLPDWLSMMLFKRANFLLDEEDKRHDAILHILRVQTENGIDAANEYLCKNHLKPLSLE